MTDRESNLAPVAPVGDSATTQSSTMDSMEGVVLESGSFENTANIIAGGRFCGASKPCGHCEATETFRGEWECVFN